MANREIPVSIVIPVRDRADLLKACVESLAAQDFPAEEFEVVVCDDGSRSELSGAIRQFQPRSLKLRIVRQAGRGPAAARNMGIRKTIAPTVIFLDSDVVADPKLIRCLVDALMNNPGWAGAEASLIPVDGNISPLWDAPGAATGGRFHTAAIAYRRNALISAGGLDESFPLPACEDVELAARILPMGPIGFVPEAKAYHPRRKVDLRMHWRSRLHWKYVVILAKRYGFLAFPERRIGRFSRLRVAWAAVATLPAGRLLRALSTLPHTPSDSIRAAVYALFDIFCGLCALPGILLCPIPERMDYLQRSNKLEAGCRP